MIYLLPILRKPWTTNQPTIQQTKQTNNRDPANFYVKNIGKIGSLGKIIGAYKF